MTTDVQMKRARTERVAGGRGIENLAADGKVARPIVAETRSGLACAKPSWSCRWRWGLQGPIDVVELCDGYRSRIVCGG